MKIREYKNSDELDVINLINNMFNKNYNHIGKADNIDSFVVEEDNKIIGYMDITYNSDIISNRKYALFNYICISDEYGGRGYGKDLVNYGINRCIEKNINYIRLTSKSKRIKAIDMYVKLGFVKIDTNTFERVIL